MNNLQVFNYGKQEVRTVLIENSPWWVLADVCKVLGLRNATDTAKRLDEDEKGVDSIYTIRGKQKMIVINESGLYSVILRSDKPEAKAFKHWITHEVLPSIRKTGTYATEPTKTSLSGSTPHDIPLAPPPQMSVENRLRRAEMLLRAAEFKTCDRIEQQRLVDLAVQDLIGNLTSSATLPLAQPVYPIIPDNELMILPERIGVIKNAGMKRCGDVNVPFYTTSEIASMVGMNVAEFNSFADEHRLKTSFNGEWVRIQTPHGQAREFLYTIDVIRSFRKHERTGRDMGNFEL